MFKNNKEEEYVPIESQDIALQSTQTKRSTLFSKCFPILGTELCERLAYYGIATNLIIYLTSVMGIVSDKAASQVNLFEGICYITPLIGALLADSVLGRFKTILVASSVYLLGMVMLTLSASLPSLRPSQGQTCTTFQFLFLNLCLAVIALGTGGIKPVVSTFGAGQFDDKDPTDKVAKASFFNWFYFVINVGSLISGSVIVYIQENKGWAIGFAIPTFAMLMAILCFVSGFKKYKHAPTSESPILRVIKVVYTALVNRYRSWRQNGQAYTLGYQRTQQVDKENVSAPYNISQASNQSQPKEKLVWLDWAMQGRQVYINSDGLQSKRLNMYTYKQVQEVKSVLGLVPYFVYMIFYWLIYQQMTTFFVLQGEYMQRDVSILGRQFKIPSASMSIFNTLGIIVLIPLYDSLFVPLLRRFKKKIDNLQRTGIGFVVAIITMIYAAIIERHRLQQEARNVDLPVDQQYHISIFWLAGSYLLVAISELFSSIGQIEFFYDEAPDAMRSTASALSLLSTAFGSFLASGLITLIQFLTSLHGKEGWLPQNLNNGRLDLFYIICAGFMVVNLIFYSWSAYNYEYSKLNDINDVMQQQESEQDKAIENIPAATSLGLPISAQKKPEEDFYGRSIVVQPITPPYPNPFK